MADLTPLFAGPLPMTRTGSSENYIIKGKYGRYPSCPAQHSEGKISRSQSTKSVPDNHTSPHSAPAAVAQTQRKCRYFVLSVFLCFVLISFGGKSALF